jgi:ribosome-associated translation inhibitor RaiA
MPLSGNRHAATADATGTRPAGPGQLELQDKNMQIQINTDHHIEGSEARDEWARNVVESSLGHLADSVTRVEVHFSLESAGKPGVGDMRCLVEARLNGRPPIAVTNDAEGLDAALNGAVHKLVRAMEHALGRADKHAHDARVTPGGDADEFVPSAAPF